jgi:hypothetical protein
MEPVLPIDLRLLKQPDVRFVDESCRLERVIGSFKRELSTSHGTQFVVDHRHDTVERISVSCLGPLQQLCYIGAG